MKELYNVNVSEGGFDSLFLQAQQEELSAKELEVQLHYRINV